MKRHNNKMRRSNSTGHRGGGLNERVRDLSAQGLSREQIDRKLAQEGYISKDGKKLGDGRTKERGRWDKRERVKKRPETPKVGTVLDSSSFVSRLSNGACPYHGVYMPSVPSRDSGRLAARASCCTFEISREVFDVLVDRDPSTYVVRVANSRGGVAVEPLLACG